MSWFVQQNIKEPAQAICVHLYTVNNIQYCCDALLIHGIFNATSYQSSVMNIQGDFTDTSSVIANSEFLLDIDSLKKENVLSHKKMI